MSKINNVFITVVNFSRSIHRNNDPAEIVFRLMKEEYDMKLQSVIKSENIYKNKLLLLEERLASTEVQFEKTENKLKECMSNLNNMDQVNFVKMISWVCVCVCVLLDIVFNLIKAPHRSLQQYWTMPSYFINLYYQTRVERHMKKFIYLFIYFDI